MRQSIPRKDRQDFNWLGLPSSLPPVDQFAICVLSRIKQYNNTTRRKGGLPEKGRKKGWGIVEEHIKIRCAHLTQPRHSCPTLNLERRTGFAIQLPRAPAQLTPFPKLGVAVGLGSCDSPHTGRHSLGHRLFAHAPEPRDYECRQWGVCTVLHHHARTGRNPHEYR